MSVPILAAALLVLAFFTSGLGGPLALAIGLVAFLEALLVLVLASFFQPGIPRSRALVELQFTSTDPRAVFARAARTAVSGEITVSYTLYRRVHRLTIAGAALLLLLVAWGILREAWWAR